MNTFSARWRSRASAFLKSRSATGAVEFAIVAPMLMLMYLGGAEVSVAMSIDRKVGRAAATVADLVTQQSTVTADDLRGIMQSAKAIIAPYASADLKLRVTAIKIDATGTATVEWSCPSTGLTKLATGSVYALPASFALVRNRSIIVSETVFAYTPISAAVFVGPIEMGSTEYVDPRIGTAITSSGCTTVAL